MNKQKYLGFLLVGLVLAIGLFGFISYSIKNNFSVASSSNVIERPLLNEPEPIQKKQISISLERPIEKSNTQKQQASEDIRSRLFAHSMKRIKEDEIRKELGKRKLKEIIENQPFELSPLFELSDDKYDGKEYKYITGSVFESHQAEIRDINWSDQAEAFLFRYFTVQSDNKFVILRVDCKLSNCEVAGVVNGVRTVSSREVGLLIGTLFNAELENSAAFKNLFSGVNWPYFAFDKTNVSNQIPFSFLISRKSPFSHPDAVF